MFFFKHGKDEDKAGTARMFLSKMIENENTNIYSLEVSMYGYKPDRNVDNVVTYKEENCNMTGCLCQFTLLFVFRYSTGAQHLPGVVGLLQDIGSYRGL